MRDQLIYGGFWVRVLADFVDSALMNVSAFVSALLFYGLLYGMIALVGKQSDLGEFALRFFDPFAYQLVFFGFRIGFSALYLTCCHRCSGATWGKRLFHLKVVQWADGQSLNWTQSWIRTVNYLFSYFTCGVGYWMVAFHPQKRALHDLLSQTMVVRVL